MMIFWSHAPAFSWKEICQSLVDFSDVSGSNLRSSNIMVPWFSIFWALGLLFLVTMQETGPKLGYVFSSRLKANLQSKHFYSENPDRKR